MCSVVLIISRSHALSLRTSRWSWAEGEGWALEPPALQREAGEGEGGHCRRSHRSFHFWSRMTKGESFCPSSRRPRRWRAICFLTFLHFAPFVSGVRFPLIAYTARPRHCQAAIFLSRTSPLIASISVWIMVFPWRGEEGEATGAATPRSLPARQEIFSSRRKDHSWAVTVIQTLESQE